MLHGVRNPGGVSCLRYPPGSFCFRGVCCVFLFGFANSQNPISATHCPCQLQTARRAGPASARKRPHGAAQGERRGLPFASPVQVVVGAYMRGVFDDLFEKKVHFSGSLLIQCLSHFAKLSVIMLRKRSNTAKVIVHPINTDAIHCLFLQDFMDGIPHCAFLYDKIFHENKGLRLA